MPEACAVPARDNHAPAFELLSQYARMTAAATVSGRGVQAYVR